VDEFEYILPLRLIASCGDYKSAIVVSSLAWLIELFAFLRSMYSKKYVLFGKFRIF
jgi:hypothetical protein